MTDTSVASLPVAAQQPTLQGYLRRDGRKGIRNVVAVAYLVECAHHVAREIVTQFREPLDAFDDPSAEREPPVHLIGFPGCYPNGYAEKCSSGSPRIPMWARCYSCRSVARA